MKPLFIAVFFFLPIIISAQATITSNSFKLILRDSSGNYVDDYQWRVCGTIISLDKNLNVKITSCYVEEKYVFVKYISSDIDTEGNMWASFKYLDHNGIPCIIRRVEIVNSETSRLKFSRLYIDYMNLTTVYKISNQENK